MESVDRELKSETGACYLSRVKQEQHKAIRVGAARCENWYMYHYIQTKC